MASDLTSDLLKAPTKQLQAIIRQKQQKNLGLNYESLYAVNDGSERLRDLLNMKKVTTTGLQLQQASKALMKATNSPSASKETNAYDRSGPGKKLSFKG